MRHANRSGATSAGGAESLLLNRSSLEADEITNARPPLRPATKVKFPNSTQRWINLAIWRALDRISEAGQVVIDPEVSVLTSTYLHTAKPQSFSAPCWLSRQKHTNYLICTLLA